MLGILLGLITAGWYYLGPELSTEASVYAGIHVLLYAQLAFTVLTVIMSVFILFGGMNAAKAFGGIMANNAFGAVAGFAIPGFQMVALVWLILTRALLLLGTWLMYIAGDATMTFAEMDLRRLICGALLVFVSLWISHKWMSVSVK